MRLEGVATIEYLKEAFYYDYITGILHHAKDRPKEHFKSLNGYNNWKRLYSGKPAGTIVKNKNTYYMLVKVKNVKTTVHRVIFCIFYGYFPLIIDHLDGNGLNNRVQNLVNASFEDNSRNMAMCKNNTSGITGVGWNKLANKWRAVGSTSIDGVRKNISLGYYDDIEEATKVRKLWQEANGYSKRHGK